MKINIGICTMCTINQFVLLSSWPMLSYYQALHLR